MEALLTVSGNDLRQSINNMELVHHMGSITNDNVYNTCDVPYYTSIEKLIQAILAHKFYDAIDCIDDFINQEFIHFSKYDCDRSIPNLMDGLKNRKGYLFYQKSVFE